MHRLQTMCLTRDTTLRLRSRPDKGYQDQASQSSDTAVDSKVQKMVTCVGDIGVWMRANRLKLNQDKTQFIWLGSPHQLSKVRLQSIRLGDVDILDFN